MANLFIGLGGAGLKTVREIRKKQREGDYFLFIYNLHLYLREDLLNQL
jgi:hypothetical protein